jgi:hypothetical protein
VIVPPVFPAKLPGTLWGVTTYFNPAGYRNRLRNYDIFSRRIRSQGLPLIVAEAAFGDAPFVLPDDAADIVVRVRTKGVLWQKERLLNLARRHLPPDCDKMVWLDADICFLNSSWPAMVADALEQYIIVQPYRTMQQAPQGYVPPDHLQLIDRSLRGECGYSSAHSYRTLNGQSRRMLSGYPGYACAARRSVMDEIDGLYEYMIVGGGDSLFFGACHGIHFAENNYICEQEGCIREHTESWCDAVYRNVGGSVCSIDADSVHLWHGDRNERFYAERRILLRDFNPLRDLHANKDGCLEWTDAADPALKRNVELYFSVRNEDGPSAEAPAVTALRGTLMDVRRQATPQAR